MHSFLVALAYLAMLFAPCAVAQWGGALSIEWTFRFSSSRRRASDPMLVALRRDRRRSAAYALAEVTPLLEAAFVAPPRIAAPFVARQFATPAQLHARAAAEARSSAFEQGVARVTARLAELAEAHRLANQPQVDPLWAASETGEHMPLAASSPRKPVVSAHVYDPALLVPEHGPAPLATEHYAMHSVSAAHEALPVFALLPDDDSFLQRLRSLITTPNLVDAKAGAHAGEAIAA